MAVHPSSRNTPPTPSGQDAIDDDALLTGGQPQPGPGAAPPREGVLPAHGPHNVLDELGLLPGAGRRS